MSVKRIHQVQVELPRHKLVLADFTVEQLPGRKWKLIADIPDYSQIAVSGGDLFECLRSLKRITDPASIHVLCNGARREAWASGLLRDMTGASKLYITRLGMQTKRSDLVPIFGTVPVEAVATVEEQDAYHKQWLRSLGDDTNPSNTS